MIQIESRLEEFAKIYDCEFSKEKQIVGGFYPGSRIHITIMEFRSIHNGIHIFSRYEFGHQHAAEFNFEIKPKRKIPEFKISTKNHFFRIFSLSDEVWKIECDNQLLIASLKDYLNKSGMTELSKKAAFIPTIHGKYLNGTFSCESKFHLGFDDKEESFKPNMEFHKILIDKLQENYCS